MCLLLRVYSVTRLSLLMIVAVDSSLTNLLPIGFDFILVSSYNRPRDQIYSQQRVLTLQGRQSQV